ncbi:MAG TPA: flagellar motor switch protein FliN [Rhizobium sp.]|nr:flagellar motor switch protein FliN [Rhizobium sp.]
MATKKTPVTEDDALSMMGSDADFDQAVDDLRGVLKNDSEGTLPDIGADFESGIGGDFANPLDSAGDLSAFESDFGGPSIDVESTDFGADAFGSDPFSAHSEPTPAQAAEPGSSLTSNLDLIMDIPIDLQIVLGSSRMQVSGLMNLEEGAIIALDKKIGEPVEITVNGRRIARGEITVLDNDDTRFGVKLIEVMSTKLP